MYGIWNMELIKIEKNIMERKKKKCNVEKRNELFKKFGMMNF